MTPAAQVAGVPWHRKLREGFPCQFASLPESFRLRIEALDVADRIGNEPKESRNGFANPFGKLGKAINGLTLPVEIEEDLRQRATHAGIPFLELLRELIVIAERGRDAVDATLKARLDAIEGKQQE